MRIDCVRPTRPPCGIYKSAPRWRKSANEGSKASCALPHRPRGLVSVDFYGIKIKNKNKSSSRESAATAAQTAAGQQEKESLRGCEEEES